MALNSPNKNYDCVAWHGADTGIQLWNLSNHEDSRVFGYHEWSMWVVKYRIESFERVNIAMMANSS